MAIARVQSTSATTGVPSNSTTLALTFGAATTAGNTVIVGLSSGSFTNFKVTSTHGIFSQIYPMGGDTAGGNLQTCIFFGIMTGADTVITISGPTTFGGAMGQVSAVAAEYSGALIMPDNIPAVVNAASTNAANTGNVANINANALFVGIIGVKVTTATQNTSWAFNNVAPFSIVNSITTNNASASNIDRGICYLDAVVSTVSTRGANVNHGFGINRYAGSLATFDQGVTGGGIRTAGHGGLAA